ncbi:MAG: hypothetical protein AABO41_21550 [Acidobacteriota bacterium]
MSEKKLPQLRSTQADGLIDEAAEFLVEFMHEFNATHSDSDAHEIVFRPSLILCKEKTPDYGARSYFEQLCALTLAQEYVIAPGTEGSVVRGRESEMEAY